MLMYRRTQGQPITLYYRKSIEHRPRMVPKELAAKKNIETIQSWDMDTRTKQDFIGVFVNATV